MKMKISFPSKAVQRGVTLVELMVSITIGLLIVLFVSSLYLSSRSSYRVNDDNSRMQEEGRAAMFVLGRNLMQAGFGILTLSDSGAQLQKTAFEDIAVVEAGLGAFRACDNGFTAPATQDFTCGAGGKPAFEISYMVDAYDGNIGAGADCNGQEVKYKLDKSKQFAPGDTKRYTLNRFYVQNGTLFCAGNGNATPQPLLGNASDLSVVDMQLRYGVHTNGALKTSDDFKNGYKSVDAIMTTKAAVEAVSGQWKNVVRVEVCLELSGPNRVTPGNQTYVNCQGQSITATDGKLHAVMNGVYTLRNNASPRNFAL